MRHSGCIWQPDRVPMTLQSVASRRSSYIDFLLPGVLSLAIMQSGIFGVAFGFVSLRKRGSPSPPVGDSHETPGFHCGPGDHAADGSAGPDHCPGRGRELSSSTFSSWEDCWIFSPWVCWAGAVFLAIGFFLAGIARTEDQVVPLANVVSLPMMLLSGVFFSRSNLPEPVRVVTEFFPPDLPGRRHA